jgi:hypothetical protein
VAGREEVTISDVSRGKGSHMNSSKISAGLLLGAALLVSGSAVAAERASLKFYEGVNVGGTQVTPGEYTLRWEGNGPNVELNILKGGSVVAKVPARLVDASRAADSNTTVTTANSDGSRSLSEIKLRGKKYTLEIGVEPAQTAAASNTK